MRNLDVVSLKELLPSSIAHDKDVLAAAEAIDAELMKATRCVPDVSLVPRLREISNSAIIDLFAWAFHVDFYDPAYPLEKRRDLVVKALDWHTRKGTPSAVEEVVTTLFSDASVTEWWEYEEAEGAGYGERGFGEGGYGGIDHASDPYYFRVITEDPIADADKVAELIEAIWSVKNTRSWLDGIYSLKKFMPSAYVAARHYCLEEDVIGLRRAELPDIGTIYVGVGLVIKARINI